MKELNPVPHRASFNDLFVSRSSSILRPSVSGLLSPIHEPSDDDVGFGEIGKMNGVPISVGYSVLPEKLGWGIWGPLKALNLFMTLFRDFPYLCPDPSLKTLFQTCRSPIISSQWSYR